MPGICPTARRSVRASLPDYDDLRDVDRLHVQLQAAGRGLLARGGMLIELAAQVAHLRALLRDLFADESLRKERRVEDQVKMLAPE